MAYPGFDEEWLANRQTGVRLNRNSTQPREAAKPTTGKGRLGNIRCEADGIKFPSKLERDVYLTHKLELAAGEIQWFIRQPMFDLPGGVTHKSDFLAVMADGSIRIQDAKGFATAAFIKAKKMVEALYPIEIEVIK